jgi:2-keto-4-pentenoate hydratase/2-oxohepta-3-ene-1,7-dioic acid hydratase in catechol pathway
MIMDVLPRNLVGIAHNKTLNNHPLPIQAWHKSLRTIVGDGEPIVARRGIGTVNVEGELAVIIGQDTFGLTVENAFDYIAGFTIANDVTNVDRNAEDEKMFQGKGGAGYTPLGPRVVDTLPDPDRTPIRVFVNDQLRADSGTQNLPSTIAASLAYVAAWVPLGPGDVIMTGAPGTAVAVQPGDVVRIEIDGIGALENQVT